jgi:putative Ca2+/H+ antiporter (TMEM165/GDT1 family)
MNTFTIIAGIMFIIFGVFTLIENRYNKERNSYKRFSYKWFAFNATKIWNTYVPIISGVIFIAAGIQQIPILQIFFKTLSRVFIDSLNSI